MLAPTIFMMAISSRRPKVASLMVLDMIKTDTNTRMTISTRDTTLTMLRTVTKKSAYSRWAKTFAIPSTASRSALVSDIKAISDSWMTKRWRKTSSSMPTLKSESYWLMKLSMASVRETNWAEATLGTASMLLCSAAASASSSMLSST